MGITKSCGSTTWRNKEVFLSLHNSTSPFVTASSPTQTQLLDVRLETQFGLTLARVSLGVNADTYWAHPTDLRGNLMGMYGNVVMWTVLYDSTDVAGTPTQPRIIIYGRNNTRIDLA